MGDYHFWLSEASCASGSIGFQDSSISISLEEINYYLCPTIVTLAGPILESKGMRAIFQKKGKKGQEIWKFGQKCTKLENILKKGSLMRATIAHMKQLEYALFRFFFYFFASFIKLSGGLFNHDLLFVCQRMTEPFTFLSP